MDAEPNVTGDAVNRRRALALGAGTAALLAGRASAASAQQPPATPPDTAARPRPDMDPYEREKVRAAGMTEAEADAWVKLADAAGALLALPKLHPMDEEEVVAAVHALQWKLLSRPTYRRYREISKDFAKRRKP